MTPRSVEALNRWTYDPTIHLERSKTHNIDMRSPEEHLANIRETLALNMSEMAAVLGVTRPTAYAWLSGQEPKPESVTQIQRISRFADELNRLPISRVDTLVRRPILDGRSLLDRLKANEDPLQVLNAIRTIAEKEALSRRLLKGAGKHLHSLDEVAGDHSAPLYERS